MRDLTWLGQERNLPYGTVGSAGEEDALAHVAWEAAELTGDAVDYLSKFTVHIPTCNGKLASKHVELKCIEYAYDWFMYMTTHEEDVGVFEAAVLVIASMTILEEKAGTLMGCTVFGLSLEMLLGEVGRALDPKAGARLLTLVQSSIESQRKRQNCADEVQTLLKISSCYLDYMRWRNVDGYYEVAMLCSFAAMGESCSGLTVGTANDILEAAILAHDTHSVLRHFEEDEMANCHRYLDPNLRISIERAFRRVAHLRNQIRFHPDIPPSIKRCAMVAISSCHSFNYACRRYRYGADFATAASFVRTSPKFSSPFSNLPKAIMPFSILSQNLPKHA